MDLCFRGLSPQSAENERLAILAIRKDKEGQLMILAGCPRIPMRVNRGNDQIILEHGCG
ncbi:MAG UNVERIFIED_CONTAM: hypothetical protein LVR29_30075 [Microcystis novacekii LVE1205-3]